MATPPSSPATGLPRSSLFWKQLIAFVALAVLPLAGTGLVVTIQVDNVREQADHISRTYERRAENIASKVAAFLRQCEADLVALSKLDRTNEAYTNFVNGRKREIWIRSGTNQAMTEERSEIPLYKEASFANATGQERVLVMRGRPMPSESLRNISEPRNTTYRSEKYFLEAMELKPGEIYISHLNGFHVNKTDQLGVEKIISVLKRKSPQDKQIYRYLLYEILRAAGEMEYVDSFTEGDSPVPGPGTATHYSGGTPGLRPGIEGPDWPTGPGGYGGGGPVRWGYSVCNTGGRAGRKCRGRGLDRP
jgi:hypothetical protein